MRQIWEYISARAKYALSRKSIMSLTMATLGIFNICLIIFYSVFSVYPMVSISVISSVLYLWCYVQARQDKNLLLVFNLSYAEILIHAVLAVLFLGVDSGYTLYIIAMLPFGYYAAYNFSSEKKHVNPMFYVIFSGVAFCFARISGNYIGPLYSYGNKHVDRIVYIVNFFVAVIAIVLFFSTLMNEIKYLDNLRMHQNQTLEKLSKTDALTGLSNRRSLQERYSQAEMMKEEYALILGDIDDFKKVNDTYGHNVGDQVLKAVAEVFKSAVRGEDTVCRWGGEEILIFLPKCPLDNARYRAEKIMKNVREIEFKSTDQSVFHITMTLGVSVSKEAASFMETLKKADERLYFGKQHGKNQVV